MYVSTVQQMRELDRRAIEEYRIPDELLMENAGEAVYYVILRQVGVKGRRFLVVSGPGNNGGDGFVVARKLRSTGGTVRVAVVADPTSYAGPSERNLDRLRKAGLDLLVEPGPEDLAGALATCDTVVDGLLGTGLTRDVDGAYAEMVREINASSATVFSIDIPSGVDGDNGRIRGSAVEADTTVTFGLPKLGNVLGPGAALGGRLYVSHISFPQAITGDAAFSVALNEPVPLPPVPGAGKNARMGRTDPPHPDGSLRILRPEELSEPTGRTVDAIEADPITPLQELTGRLDAPVVLQGHRALIGLPDGRVLINPSGSLLGPEPGRDQVIRKAVGDLHARGLSPEEAVRTGVFVEGVAADLAARGGLTTNLPANDVAAQLPRAMNMLWKDFAGLTPDYYGTLEVI